jgi:hypothetical protein
VYKALNLKAAIEGLILKHEAQRIARAEENR